MDKTREYREYLEQQQKRSSGVVGDLQRLKTEGSATAAELREFLSHLKGRSPKEVMGVVAESELIRCTVIATVGCFVLLVVMTVVPYALSGRSSSVAEKKPAAAAVAQPTNEEPTAAVEKSASTPDQAATTDPEPDLERAAKAMGIGGTADADPNSNPLDNKLDKLLDGIE
jgi:hypothetical protein